MNPEQWLSLKWNDGSTMSDRWLNQSKIIQKTTRKDENRLKDFCKACEKALKQIKEKHYDQKLEEEGYETILNYGIACYKKRCKVMVDK